MTIYSTLLKRGYFPKELPPSFYTELFSSFATTKTGREVLDAYKPPENYTDCVAYELARSGGDRRKLEIPHPATYTTLAGLVARNMSRLLRKSGMSPFAKSRPVYSDNKERALQGSVKPTNLTRERALIRSGARYLLKADVSGFYPSLYTHAVGWAVNAQLRQRENWHNKRLLGHKLDQALMNLQGKISQGIPIGPDVSFLLAEIVLAQVDRALQVSPQRAFRWYDDYEFACDTLEEAEGIKARLGELLRTFRIRLNPHKTKIVALPTPTEGEWHGQLLERGKGQLKSPEDMVRYFDLAFHLRTRFPDAPVLLYAIGILFRLRRPSPEVGGVAESAITQALLAEPGVAQKAYALLTFWTLNGYASDTALLGRTIDQIILRHEASGVSSDVAWALSFCLEHGLQLNKASGEVLSEANDSCVTIQAMHLQAEGLLNRGFSKARIKQFLRSLALDGEHWLLGYESVRQGFDNTLRARVEKHALFGVMLDKEVTFYRRRLPPYAAVLHSGGGPQWVIRKWLRSLEKGAAVAEESVKAVPMLKDVGEDLESLAERKRSPDETILDLLDVLEPKDFAVLVEAGESYAGFSG